MRIAIDLTSLADSFSGIRRFAANVAENMILQNTDDEYILIFKREIFELFHPYEGRANVQMIVLKDCGKFWCSQVTLPLCLYGLKADRWLFMAFSSPLFFFRKGTVSTIHDIGCWDHPEAMTRFSVMFFRALYRKAALFDDRLVTVSEFSKGRIMQRLSVREDRIWVVYNGLSQQSYEYLTEEKDISTLRAKYNLPGKYILCLSTLEPRKNMRLLIDACRELWLEGLLEADLVLAGRKGWKIDDLLESLEPEVAQRIHLTGFVEERDLSTLYHNADVFVFPSIYEGFGIPPLEALAVGVNVISSDAASMPEVLGDAAFYFKSNDLKDLKETILKFYHEQLGVRGHLPRAYDWKHSAKAMRKAIE